MSNYYEDAPEVRTVALEMIESEDYPELQHLRHLLDASIARLVFRWIKGDTIPKENGLFRMGKAVKVTAEAAFDAGRTRSYFRIVITYALWEQMTPGQRQALVYHELSHCFVDGDGNLHILPHEFTGFTREVKRFGCWSDDLKALILQAGPKIAKQMGLDYSDEEDELDLSLPPLDGEDYTVTMSLNDGEGVTLSSQDFNQLGHKIQHGLRLIDGIAAKKTAAEQATFPDEAMKEIELTAEEQAFIDAANIEASVGV